MLGIFLNSLKSQSQQLHKFRFFIAIIESAFDFDRIKSSVSQTPFSTAILFEDDLINMLIILQTAQALLAYQRIQESGQQLLLYDSPSLSEFVIEKLVDFTQQIDYKKHMQRLLSHTRNNQLKKDLLACQKSNYAQQFKFGGEEVGFIGNQSQHEKKNLKKFPDDCFESAAVQYKRLSNTSVQLEISVGKKKHNYCSQAYIIGTGGNINFRALNLKKKTKIVWKNLTNVQIKNIDLWGIHIFRTCDRIVHILPDLIKTAQLFVGGLGTNPKIPFFGSKTPEYQQRLNVKFIQDSTGYRWKQRINKFVDLSDSQVKPGDFLAITRFDGVDQIIQYGAGSHSGHSAVILQVDGQIVVCQSQDGWYWPKHGIQRNTWDQWKKWALNAGFNVAVLPLSPQSRSKFNKTAAEQQFKRLQGFPYGYHNFLFGWIDTANQSLPTLLDPDLIVVLFGFLQRIYDLPFRMILTQALNKRLNTTNLKLDQIAVEIAKHNTTIGQLMAVVQKDGWWYSDGWSYVCSAFAAAIYKEGGLLTNVEATQFTPRDIYIMDIFDKNYSVPSKCKANDPTLPYCQIMGNWLMELPQYATITPYPHMNQRCPTQAPDFKRTQGC